MTIGDLGPIARDFFTVEQKVAEILPEIWARSAPSLGTEPIEDEITRALTLRLQQHPKGGRMLGPVIPQYPLLEEERLGDVVTKGVIDIAIIIDSDARYYVPFECKRVNVVDGNGRLRSLADLYVTEGMMRYICAKYAEEIPIGAMIGYVMNGDVADAEAAILHSIEVRREDLKLVGGAGSRPQTFSMKRLNTSHTRDEDGGVFGIQHTLLPFPCPWTIEEASQCSSDVPAPRRRRRLAPGRGCQ